MIDEKRVGRLLASIDVDRLRKIHEESGTDEWHLEECFAGSNCWCRVIRNSRGDEIVQAATLPQQDCRMLAELHNLIPVICELREWMEDPCFCRRCGLDMKLWMYPAHAYNCSKMTERDYEIMDLKEKIEILEKFIKGRQ